MMTIELKMFRRDAVFNRNTAKFETVKSSVKVSHSSVHAHSVSAFWSRGGRTNKEFEKLAGTMATKILAEQKIE